MKGFRAKKNTMFLLGILFTAVVVLMALLAGVLSPHDYSRQDLPNALKPPFWADGGKWTNPLGTDHLGRDILSRIFHGARASLLVGVGSVLIASIIGIFLGLISGFYGRWVDSLIMRIADVQLSFPPIFLAIALMAFIPPSLSSLILVLGVVTWVQFGRVSRGSTLSVKEKDYVEAARSLGTSNINIMLRHILPNILSPLVVIATVSMSWMILAEAGLSFLGLGVQPPTPAWGSMLSEGRTYFGIAWWYATFPGLAIFVTVLGLNMLGDGLRRLQI
ncbi:MAG: ABC transporter permease [Deltaproteobacteria bacterium]|nr:ABC transporter permease [Deltaproteobacteria bacterium]